MLKQREEQKEFALELAKKYMDENKMVKLTPSRIIDLRRDLIPLVGEENATEALKQCKAIHKELGGQAEIDAVLEEFKSRNVNEINVIKQINEVDNMKDFWEKVEDPTEFHPFLKVKYAIKYALELVDPEAEPRPSVDSFSNDQYIFDVILRGITPKKALEEVNADGYKLFEIGKEYAFAVKKKGRSMKRFKELWLNEGPITGFTFKRTGKGFQTDFVYEKVD